MQQQYAPRGEPPQVERRIELSPVVETAPLAREAFGGTRLQAAPAAQRNAAALEPQPTPPPSTPQVEVHAGWGRKLAGLTILGASIGIAAIAGPAAVHDFAAGHPLQLISSSALFGIAVLGLPVAWKALRGQ